MESSIAVLPDELALVSRAVAEPAAFAAIYDHYFPRVYNYVMYRVGNLETADDLTAQAFERVLEKIGSYRPERAPFGAWLFAVVRNMVRDHHRAQRRRRWLSLDALHNQPSDEPLPEEIALCNETHAELLAALARLKARERDLIALKFAAGLTNRYIARLTGLSESNVGVMLYRTIRRLRAELSTKEYHDAGD